ncbi:MAG: DMT family transporter [Bacteroidaceae bacterium]|nr:DMT family transporter [Bacteroidaceae bacterium]
MLGEIISFIVALSWTATALFAEVASKRWGTLPFNVVRMILSLLLLSVTLWCTIGSPYPVYADGHTWMWLGLSGFVGYVLGDYCLFQSYVLIGSRFGQLFMTLSAPSAAIAAWIMLGEKMSALAIVGMLVTMFGIGLSVLNKNADSDETNRRRRLQLKLPVRGVLFAIGAGMGQGIGLVFSKVGMQAYSSSLAAHGADLGFMMPFASTMIRAVIGLIGFTTALFLFTSHGKQKLSRAAHDGRGMACAFGAAMMGPFFGVSLSLMATLYTSTGIAQTIMALTPIFILLPSRLLFKQKVTALEVLGAFISVCGVCLFFV